MPHRGSKSSPTQTARATNHTPLLMPHSPTTFTLEYMHSFSNGCFGYGTNSFAAVALHGCVRGRSRFDVTHFSQTRGGGGSRVLQHLCSGDLLGQALGRFCCERAATLSRVLLFHLDHLKIHCEIGDRGTNQRRDTVVPFVFFSSFEG